MAACRATRMFRGSSVSGKARGNGSGILPWWAEYWASRCTIFASARKKLRPRSIRARGHNRERLADNFLYTRCERKRPNDRSLHVHRAHKPLARCLDIHLLPDVGPGILVSLFVL